ncbi:nadh:ubiquinone oxidoreductase 30kda subunit [Lucifera butyrica]|uniref:Nadh:ubiquinone oxidoreductase 30kda subunit n=1 Tax=Lucifera butyrica TaxID=1351585 RepID=A0A498RAK2_9FIRM|nr:NADH-quinone oxidoreductase subunit C [Lucifera butyrica]VBB09756.1 nadh:ubiquinone oxidoreductase 30kda subunit [Lucifera butyrica]
MSAMIPYQELSPVEFQENLARKGSSGQYELFHYTVLKESPGAWSILAVIGEPKQGTCEWLKTIIPGGGRIDSLAAVWPALLWPEREIHDQTDGIIENHPDLRPLLYPERVELRGVAHGSGTFHLPLGPVRSDVTESLLFLFDILGEQIMFLESQLFYKHRQVEVLGRGKKPGYGVLLAERVAGTSTVAHAVAFTRAIEQALGRPATIRQEQERVLLGEMERLYNHAGDLAQLAGATGMTVGQAQFARIKEELLRLNADLCGSRYLRSTVRIHGDSGVNWTQQGGSLLTKLQDIARRFEQFTSLLKMTPTFVDRLKGTGIIKKEWARAFDLVGPVARGNRIGRDVRLNYRHKGSEWGNWSIAVNRQGTGDAFSRFGVRVEEWTQSLHLIQFLLSLLEEPEWGRESGAGTPCPSPTGWGHGLAESPRGRTSHIVNIDREGNIAFWNIRSASGSNWPVFGLATANENIQTDFPIIEASFALSVASCDR